MTGSAFTVGKGCCSTTFEKDEGALSQTTKTIEFTIVMSEITIINDSESECLSFKFSESGEFATLRPKETITISIKASNVFLSSSFVVDYRVWGVG